MNVQLFSLIGITLSLTALSILFFQQQQKKYCKHNFLIKAPKFPFNPIKINHKTRNMDTTINVIFI